MIKNRYKDDYQKTGAGKYDYIGKHYTLPMDEKGKTRSGWVNLGVLAGFFLLEICGGLVNQDSSRTAWIVFPYLFLYLPTFYMGMGAFTYLAAPLRMERSAYERSLLRMRRSCIGIMALAGLGILLDVVYIALYFHQILLIKELIYLAFLGAAELLGVCYGKLYDRMYAGITVD